MRKLVGALVLSALLTGCTSTVAGTALPADTHGPTKEPEVSAADLAEILVPVNVINSVMDATSMVSTWSGSGLSDEDNGLDAPECLGAMMTGMTRVYAGSGWKAAEGQIVRENTDRWKHHLVEAVVLFPTAEEAEAFFTDSQKKWANCTDRRMTFLNDGETTSTWTTGEVTDTDGILAMSRLQEGGGGWGCQQALTAHSNIVIEARACGETITDQAAEIVQKSAERIPD